VRGVKMDRKIINLAFSLVMLIILNTGCGNVSIVGPEVGKNNPDKYVAFGDSITQGLNSFYGGYPALLEEKLKTYFGEAEVVNEGIGRMDSSEGLGRVNEILEREKPGYLLILFGANDIMGLPSVDETILNLRAIIQRAKNNQTIPIVGTLTPFNPWGSHGWSRWVADVYRLNIKIRELAQEENVKLADHFSAFNNDFSLLIDDGLHLNEKGYEIMAETWFEVIIE
jgi:lysophospholipase L1-like esterase